LTPESAWRCLKEGYKAFSIRVGTTRRRLDEFRASVEDKAGVLGIGGDDEVGGGFNALLNFKNSMSREDTLSKKH
jgi:hypothetical protein